MNLENKKQLASRTLHVGKNRLIFSQENLSDIKEAITKQDIKTLYEEGIIRIKPVKGRKTILKRKRKRGPGKVKIKVNRRKQIYVKITRKLRAQIKDLKNKGKIDLETYKTLRKKVKMRFFRSKAHLKEYVESPIEKKKGSIEIKKSQSPKTEKNEKKTKKSERKESKE